MLNVADSAVVFFSRDGNTRCGAEILSRKLGARLIELQEERPGNVLHALFRMRTPLKGDPWAEIATAKRVYLLCPIWAGSTVPAMNAFAEGADFTGKVVQIITFQQNPGKMGHREQRHLAGIVKRNHGLLGDCYSLTGGKMRQFAGEAFIRAQMDVVRLPDEGPEEAPVNVPEETPGGAPEEAPVSVPEETPGGAPEEAPVSVSEETPGGAPEEAPVNVPEETPGGAPEERPVNVPEEMPGGAPEEAPVNVPEETPGGAPEEKPDRVPEETPGGAPEERPVNVPEEMPSGAPEEAPVNVPEETPNGAIEEVTKAEPGEPVGLAP